MDEKELRDLMKAARRHWLDNESETAVSLCERGLAHAGAWPKVGYELLSIHRLALRNLGEHSRSRIILEEMEALAPETGDENSVCECALALAETHREQGNLEQAIAVVDGTMSSHPGNDYSFMLLVLRAEICVKLNKQDELEHTLQKIAFCNDEGSVAQINHLRSLIGSKDQ
jgi:tetratricopeptide (TPR) repeat protein